MVGKEMEEEKGGSEGRKGRFSGGGGGTWKRGRGLKVSKQTHFTTLFERVEGMSTDFSFMSIQPTHTQVARKQ